MAIRRLLFGLIGLDDPDEIFRVTLGWLGGGVAASFGADQTVLLALPEASPRRIRVRGRVDAEKLERLLDDEAKPGASCSFVGLRDGGRAIGLLGVRGDDRDRIDEAAPYVARALALAVALREARSELRVAEVSSASIRSLVEGSPLAKAFVDEVLHITAVNGVFANLVGRSIEACAGETLSELGVPEAESLEALVRRVIRGEESAMGVEVASEGPTLQRRVFLASTHPIRLGEPKRCVGAGVVLQERTAAAREEARARLVADVHAALRTEGEAAALARLVPGIADWVVLDVLERGVVRHVAAVHRDPKRRDLVLKLPTDLDRRGRPRGVALALSSRQLDSLETDDVTLMLSADPELAAVVRAIGQGPQLVVPLVRGVEAPLGALTLARVDGPPFTSLEIRAAREVAEAFVHAMLQARAVDAAQSTRDLFEDFRDVVARELRDPLTAIVGRLYLSAPKGTNVHLDAVRTAVDRMRGSLDRLVAAALPDAGRRAETTCDATEVVRHALAQQAHELARLTLTTHLEPLFVRADRERLATAFSALLSHAAAEAPSGGLVVVRLEREGEFALFTVSDTGPGFVPEHARRAFDGLWFGDRQASALTMARATIDALGGRAWIETSLGTGAAYCFTVPLA